jgi:hypothetical protein
MEYAQAASGLLESASTCPNTSTRTANLALSPEPVLASPQTSNYNGSVPSAENLLRTQNTSSVKLGTWTSGAVMFVCVKRACRQSGARRCE